MSRRRRWTLLAACLALAAAAGAAAAWYVTRPTPHRAFFEAVRLGMSEAEVDELARGLPAAPEPHGAEDDLEWEGALAGEVRRLRFTDRVPEDDPAMADSWLVKSGDLPSTGEAEGVRVYRDADGKAVLKERTWPGEGDEVLVLLDPAGRVVEKAHGRFARPSPWWDFVEDWVDRWWPFERGAGRPASQPRPAQVIPRPGASRPPGRVPVRATAGPRATRASGRPQTGAAAQIRRPARRRTS